MSGSLSPTKRWFRSAKHRRGIARAHNASRARHGFTLVEMLVVLFIFLLLAAIALPTVRNILKSSKSSQQARQIVSYLREARGRAIATKSEVGVVFNRLGPDSAFSRSLSIQMRLSNSVPPYTGENPGAIATLFHDRTSTAEVLSLTDSGRTNAAYITSADAPLLHLSAVKLSNNANADTPIGLFDRLELQGGRSVTIRGMVPVQPANSHGLGEGTKIRFDPREELFDARSRNDTRKTVAFPKSGQNRSASSNARFKIHRKPNLSSVGARAMLKGMAIDWNYSGIGPNGVQFSPSVIAPSATGAVDVGAVSIVFAPDGTVSYMNYGVDVGGTPRFSVEHPASNIYLLLGRIDGVRPDALLNAADKPPANVMNTESIWIVINPFTGLVDSSPAASVASPSSASEAVFQSRQFAFQSDKVTK